MAMIQLATSVVTSPEVIGGIIGGLIGLAGVLLAARSASSRLAQQWAASDHEKRSDQHREEMAMLEWYYARCLQLRGALVREAEAVCEFFQVINEDKEKPLNEADLRYYLESTKYQDFVGQTLAQRPALLPESLIDEFSRIRNSAFRGAVFNAELVLQTTGKESAQTSYKLQRFIEMRMDGDDRFEDVVEQIEISLRQQAIVVAALLNLAHDLIEKNPWTNTHIENWQSTMERAAFEQLKEISDRVTLPDRLIEANTEDQEA